MTTALIARARERIALGKQAGRITGDENSIYQIAEELLATITPMFGALGVFAQCADDYEGQPASRSVNVNVDRLREARDVYFNAQKTLYGKEPAE